MVNNKKKIKNKSNKLDYEVMYFDLTNWLEINYTDVIDKYYEEQEKWEEKEF